ncbi:MAG: hypothetical protein GX621_08020, partial [Pirellulaceae bacterium]|nr:hypothetical protein [Pirellulaceae bacterium]
AWLTAQNVWLAVAAAWLAGVVLLAARMAVLSSRLRRLLRGCRPVESARVADVFEAARRELGVRRRVELLASPLRVGPAVAGSLRTKMILSETLFDVLSADELRLVFLHELSHVRRHDLLVQHLWTLAKMLHWFNPAVWLSARRWQTDRELACDEAVLSLLDRPHQAGYGRAILRVMESLSSFHPVPGAVGVVMGRGFLTRRISKIARYRPLSRRWTALAVALVLLLIPAGLTNAVGKSDKPNKPEQAAARVAEEETAEEDLSRPADDFLATEETVPLARAVRDINEQAAKLPETWTLKPLTEDEVVAAINRMTRDERMSDVDWLKLKQVAEMRRLPPDVILQQFVRYGDAAEVQHGWWIRLVLQREKVRLVLQREQEGPLGVAIRAEEGPFGVTIRAQSLFRRPYTQKERFFWGELNDQVPTLNRLVAYFDEDPNFGVEQSLSAEAAQRLADRVKAAINAKDADDLMKTYDWTGVDRATREEVLTETKRLVNLPVHSVGVRPRQFDGALHHWKGLKFWAPNLPVLGYVVVEFGDKGEFIGLEFGETRGEARLVNYIVSQDDTQRLSGKSMSRPVSVRGFHAVDPDGKWLEYYAQIDAPDELSALRNANYEIMRVELGLPSKSVEPTLADNVTARDTTTKRPDAASSDTPSHDPAKTQSANVLEFRILANPRDHKAIVERARSVAGESVRDDRGELLAWWRPVSPGKEAAFADDPEVVTRASTRDGQDVLEVLLVNDPYNVTEKHLRRASVSRSPGESPNIRFELTDEGRKRFAAITAKNSPDESYRFPRKLGILVQGHLFSAPRIVDPISGGVTEFGGQFSQKEVEDLVKVLNAGVSRAHSATLDGAATKDASVSSKDDSTPKTINITGTCVDENDNPLSGVEVVVFEFGSDV